MIDCFGGAVVYYVRTRHALRRTVAPKNRDTCQRQKIHAKCYTTLVAATPPPTWLMWQAKVFPCAFQLFVASNSIKNCLSLRALKLIKAAACRALKHTHTDAHTHRRTAEVGIN